MTRIILSANTDWYLYNFRLALARRILDSGWDLLTASPDGPYAPKIVEAGVNWMRLEMDRTARNPVRELLTIRSYWSLYRSYRPDLVHHFTIKPIIHGSFAARRTSVPNVINSVVGLGYPYVNSESKARLIQGLVGPLYRLALSSYSSTTVFHNTEDRNFLIDKGIAIADNSIVIPGSGVNPNEFTPTNELPGVPVVLMVSRMLWDKGVGELVEAAKILNGPARVAQFVLVGEPDEGYPDLIPEARLRQWSEEGIVRWAGRKDDVAAEMAKAHIIALPSYGEGLPRVLLEAAASGRPVVASDIPGCRTIVRDGETGLLVPPGDSVALANALQLLIDDKELRLRMGAAGRALVMEKYTTDHINGLLVDLYSSLLS